MMNILGLSPQQGEHLLNLLGLYRTSAVDALIKTDQCDLLTMLLVILVENEVISLVFVSLRQWFAKVRYVVPNHPFSRN